MTKKSSAIPINSDADRSNSAALTPSPDAEGRIRLRDPGIGIGEEGDPMFTLQSTKPHAVAVDLQNVAIGGDIAGTLDTTRPSRGGGQAVATVVAFTKNTRDEVRQINGDGQIVGALAAEAGMKQTNYIAFAQNQLGEVRTNSEVMGTVNQNQNQNASGRNAPMVCGFSPLQGGRSMPVTPESPTLEAGTGNKTPAIAVPQGFTHSGYSNKPAWLTGDRTDCLPACGHSDGSHQGIGVQQAMQVRRLCPSECEALQGFPIGYTDVIYRKKPAADGPRYRALGNSMAVPCMWWLGHRIDKATREDNQ